MAESSDGQERSELPTDKRVREAREKGQVPRSKELASVTSLLVSGAMFLAYGGTLLQELLSLLHRVFSPPRNLIFETDALVSHFLQAIAEAIWIFAPFFAAMVVAALISGVLLSGWNFSAQAMAFKLEKLDPIKGMGRLFSWRGLVELTKAMSKFALVSIAAIVLLQAQVDQFLGLGREALPQGLAHMADLLTWAFLLVSSVLLIVVAIDVPFQLWDHQRQQKMTKQEVKDEGKQTEGNPEVKGQQRRIQREMSQRRMMAAVPEADVVITNPTHYAVALKYDADSMRAPILVAKGGDMMATQIRSIATANNVPIVSAAPLARAIYYSTELDQMIPEGLFRAVAQVLAYIFNLKAGKGYGGDGRTPLDDLPIPDDLKRDE